MGSKSGSGPGVGLSALARCLDPHIITDTLSECLALPAPWRLARAGVARLWPHKRGRFTFEYRLQLLGDGGAARELLLQGRYADRIAPSDLRIYGHAQTDVRLTEHGLAGVGLIVAPLSLVLHSPDRDRRMPWLARALDPRTFAGELSGTRIAEHLGVTASTDGVPCEIVGYRAGRRCTLYCSGGGRMYAKGFRDDRGRQLARRHDQLAEYLLSASGGRVGIPHTLGYVESMNLIAFEPFGPTFTTPQPGDERAVELAAAALRLLHGAPLKVDARHQPRHELATLTRWCEAFDALGTPETEPFRRELARLTRAWSPQESVSASLLHRDIHEAQLLIGDGCVRLIDLDTMARGDVEADLAVYLSHLLLSLAGEADGAPPFEAAAQRFLDAYRSDGGQIDDRRLRCYLASALLRLGAIHLFRRPRPHATDPLWQAAGVAIPSGDSTETNWLQRMVSHLSRSV